ncbi:helix-turn-helix transcriptional regulator [Hymenobacter sp. 15J16-1T3B]|uniref:helix-turn-helix domain-containing protein n=1 Tax=Hymenobacter sp. 15J16-1T3B TaxID=2886941 RepID=UPI001D125674|nr:helix-turn-helix domain-containing protein [Hymenobacter sp. 15J16-1T3B]MCC3158204.1 helix-turn-helix transcriptional regulator [Hymenobacter sp. 15J16-1T3B]
MRNAPPAELYTKFPLPAGLALPPDVQRSVGHFNVVDMADLMTGYRERPPMVFERRAYYKICLLRGRSRVEYADQTLDIEQQALFWNTPRVPYRWVPHDLAQAGHFCIFTDEFLLPVKGGAALHELPIFQPGVPPVLPIGDADYAALEAIFEKMAQEIASGYAYKYELLRAYLLELIYLVQKLQPSPTPAPLPSAAARVTGLFAELLERQFLLANPQQPLLLRTAKDYADALAVHVNHLNRVLKDTTGRTTSTLIGERITQEAKILLKQTTWTVSEIADSLGFADVAHFCNFFKRQTGLAPGAFRS